MHILGTLVVLPDANIIEKAEISHTIYLTERLLAPIDQEASQQN